MASADEGLGFSWGRKKAAGKNKGVQFYESFTYNGVNYSLYDHAFLIKHGLEVPFVGKIVRIWETSYGKRRVKIHRLFRPQEIAPPPADASPNELFLASGDGSGAASVNELEAISGKCNVICTSSDERNPQPSDEDLRVADFIFYRTFDVGTFEVSTEIAGAIPGVEASFVFNRKEDKSQVEIDRFSEVERGTLNVSIHEIRDKTHVVKVRACQELSDEKPAKKVKLEVNLPVQVEPIYVLGGEMARSITDGIFNEKAEMETDSDFGEADRKTKVGLMVEKKPTEHSEAPLEVPMSTNAVDVLTEADEKDVENPAVDEKQTMISGSLGAHVSNSNAEKTASDSNADLEGKLCTESAEENVTPEAAQLCESKSNENKLSFCTICNKMHEGACQVCYSCCRPGHIARNCTFLQNLMPNSGARKRSLQAAENTSMLATIRMPLPDSSTYPRSGNHMLKCYNCKQHGHQAKDCKEPQMQMLHHDANIYTQHNPWIAGNTSMFAAERVRVPLPDSSTYPLSNFGLQRGSDRHVGKCYKCMQFGHFTEDCKEPPQMQMQMFHHDANIYAQANPWIAGNSSMFAAERMLLPHSHAYMDSNLGHELALGACASEAASLTDSDAETESNSGSEETSESESIPMMTSQIYQNNLRKKCPSTYPRSNFGLQRQSGSRPIKCFNCRQRGHKSEDCKEPQMLDHDAKISTQHNPWIAGNTSKFAAKRMPLPYSRSGNPKFKCSNCNRRGHLGRNCKKPQKKRPILVDSVQRNAPGAGHESQKHPSNPIICFKCGGGHFKRNCPLKESIPRSLRRKPVHKSRHLVWRRADGVTGAQENHLAGDLQLKT